MAKSKVKILKWETYFALIKNSIGTHLFQNLYARVNGKKKDILEHGNVSCAVVVSSLLLLSGLIREVHSTVNGTLQDMEASGWKKIKKLKPGCVLLWEELNFSDTYAKKGHRHLGFYLGGEKALSNSSKLGYPVIHHLTFGKKDGKSIRNIETMYWNKKLD